MIVMLKIANHFLPPASMKRIVLKLYEWRIHDIITTDMLIILFGLEEA